MGIRADLIDTVSGIIDSIAGASGIVPCTIYLVRHVTSESPGSPLSSTFSPVLKTAAIDLMLDSNRFRRERYGIETGDLYSCTISRPTALPTTDLYAYVDSPDTGQQLSGKLVQVDPSESPLEKLYVWVGAAMPIDFAGAVGLFP